MMYLVITTLVAVFKAEKDYLIETDAVRLNIIKTYKLLFSLIELPSIKMLALILFTVKVSIVQNMNILVDVIFPLKNYFSKFIRKTKYIFF